MGFQCPYSKWVLISRVWLQTKWSASWIKSLTLSPTHFPHETPISPCESLRKARSSQHQDFTQQHVECSSMMHNSISVYILILNAAIFSEDKICPQRSSCSEGISRVGDKDHRWCIWKQDNIYCGKEEKMWDK